MREKNDQLKRIQGRAEMVCRFTVTLGEDVESVRPEFNYSEMLAQMEKVMEEIRRIKHAINVFNTTTVIPGFNMTIDEMLVYIPQLNNQKGRREAMSNMLPKQRKDDLYSYRSSSSNLVEYVYTNFDISEAEKDYRRVSRELSKAQTALDVVNNSVKFEIPGIEEEVEIEDSEKDEDDWE